LAHAKAEQNSLLHPGIYFPTSVSRAFSRAYLATIQGDLKLIEQGSIVGTIFASGARAQRLNVFTKWHATLP
jgi:hypothetical protein